MSISSSLGRGLEMSDKKKSQEELLKEVFEEQMRLYPEIYNKPEEYEKIKQD